MVSRIFSAEDSGLKSLATYVVVALMAMVDLIDFARIVARHNLGCHVGDNLFHNLYYILDCSRDLVDHGTHSCHLVMSNLIQISYFSQMKVAMEVYHMHFDEQIFHHRVFEFFDREFCDHVANAYQFLSTEK